MRELEKLAQNRDAILLAEMAGLLHNIGKLNPNFLKSTVKDEELSNDNTKKLQELREKLHSEGNAPTLEYRRMLHESMNMSSLV